MTTRNLYFLCIDLIQQRVLYVLSIFRGDRFEIIRYSVRAAASECVIHNLENQKVPITIFWRFYVLR